MSDFPRTPLLVSDVREDHAYGNKPPLAASHHYWIDGFPVTERLYVFCTAYRVTSPYVKFIASYGKNTALSTYESGQFLGHVYCEVFVYSDASEYLMGRIIHSPDEGGFGVESHKIANDRYGAAHKHYRRLWSTDVKRAVKNANKYIGAHSLVDLARRSVSSIAGKSKRTLDRAQWNLGQIVRVDRLTLAREVIHLKNQGVQFLSEEVRSFADQAQEMLDEYNQLNRYKGDAVFVSIRALKTGTQMADIGHANIYDFRRDAMAFKTEPVASLDPDFAGKLAALTMVDPGTYVENIGYRVSAQSFWVECRDV